MRKIHLFIATSLLLATTALAQSQFRQRIRHAEFHGQAWLIDDGGVATELACISDTEQALVDGGSWPLKYRVAEADGGMPTQVLNACVRTIEHVNSLDGGFQ